MVELTLAMAFIGLLLLAITMMILQIRAFYTKGAVLTQVNQAGTRIMQDMQTAFARSPLLTAHENGSLLSVQRNGDDVVVGGRLCLGTVSYVWNRGGYTGEKANRIDRSEAPLRLVKAVDRSKKYCHDMQAPIAQEDMTDLLPEGEEVLALHTISVQRVAYDAVRQAAVYAIELDIGTDDRDSLQLGDDTSTTRCRPPAAGQSRQATCAITQFQFTVQSGGRTEGLR